MNWKFINKWHNKSLHRTGYSFAPSSLRFRHPVNSGVQLYVEPKAPLAQKDNKATLSFLLFVDTIMGMRVPNAEHAFIDISKLRDYALNPTRRVGGHKARLFAILLEE